MAVTQATTITPAVTFQCSMFIVDNEKSRTSSWVLCQYNCERGVPRQRCTQDYLRSRVVPFRPPWHTPSTPGDGKERRERVKSRKYIM